MEILIGSSLISMVFITLLGIGTLALNTSSSIKKTTQIDSLIKEEIEAVRSFRDGTVWGTNGLGTVSVGGANPYYLVLDTGNPPKWILQTGTEMVNDVTRNVVFDNVSRDPSTNNIESAYNPAHLDPDTKKITVTVVSGTKTYQVVTYLTNWLPWN